VKKKSNYGQIFMPNNLKRTPHTILKYTKGGAKDGFYAKQKFIEKTVELDFTIRDAKQSGALSDCQARDNQAIEFHWNASLPSVNFGRGMSQTNEAESEKKPFSMKSIKQEFFNEHLLKLFICKSGLEQSLIKYKETLTELRNYAVIYS